MSSPISGSNATMSWQKIRPYAIAVLAIFVLAGVISAAVVTMVR